MLKYFVKSDLESSALMAQSTKTSRIIGPYQHLRIDPLNTVTEVHKGIYPYKYFKDWA